MPLNEDKREIEHLRTYLVRRFVVILVITGAVEIFLINALNVLIFPIIVRFFWNNISWENGIDNGQMVWFFLALLLELLISAIGSFLPPSAQIATNQLIYRIEDRIFDLIPQLGEVRLLAQMSRGEAFILFGVVLISVLVMILPIGVAVGVYTGLTTKEVGRIESRREQLRAEEARKRNLMLSDIAHDLRTPITTVSGYAKALADGMVTDEQKKQEYLEAIQNKSARMEELIQLLFEYSKLDSEGFSLKFERVDLAELLRENAAMLYSDVEEAGMEFEIDIPEERCIVKADALQLSRAVTNLITNAIRHNKPGCKILLSLVMEEGVCEIAVADSGEEIPPEIEATLFQPFAVGDQSRSSKGGTGLGLSIAHKVVNLHGGDLIVRKWYRGYTKAFYFTLVVLDDID